MILGCSNCSYQPWQSRLAPVPRCPGAPAVNNDLLGRWLAEANLCMAS